MDPPPQAKRELTMGCLFEEVMMADRGFEPGDAGFGGAPRDLVRWPDLSACLVRAHDEGLLALMLDEIARPGSCDTEPDE